LLPPGQNLLPAAGCPAPKGKSYGRSAGRLGLRGRDFGDEARSCVLAHRCDPGHGGPFVREGLRERHNCSVRSCQPKS